MPVGGELVGESGTWGEEGRDERARGRGGERWEKKAHARESATRSCVLVHAEWWFSLRVQLYFAWTSFVVPPIYVMKSTSLQCKGMWSRIGMGMGAAG